MVPLLIEVQRPAAGKRTSLIENPRPSVANSSIIQFPAKVFNLFHIKSESAEGWERRSNLGNSSWYFHPNNFEFIAFQQSCQCTIHFSYPLCFYLHCKDQRSKSHGRELWSERFLLNISVDEWWEQSRLESLTAFVHTREQADKPWLQSQWGRACTLFFFSFGISILILWIFCE